MARGRKTLTNQFPFFLIYKPFSCILTYNVANTHALSVYIYFFQQYLWFKEQICRQWRRLKFKSIKKIKWCLLMPLIFFKKVCPQMESNQCTKTITCYNALTYELSRTNTWCKYTTMIEISVRKFCRFYANFNQRTGVGPLKYSILNHYFEQNS